MILHRSYLDHAATSSVLPAVADAMAREFAVVGNASSLHTAGRAARRRIEEGREAIAQALGARPSEVVFTSGGTESDNIGIIGTYRRRVAQDPRRRRLIVSAIEHSAVLDAADHLVAHEGAVITWVHPGPDGIVTVDAVRDAILGGEGDVAGPDGVALVALMWVNNEVGTVQPVAQVAALAGEHGIGVHTDAVQAVGKVAFDFAASGATTAAITGHKVGGPTGLGVLLARRDAPLEALSYGGGQERGIRSGTLANALVAGVATALTEAVAAQESEAARLVKLRDRLITGVLDSVPGARVTGFWEPGDTTRRSAANAHVLVPDCEGDSLLFLLDAAGIECSTGSACHAGVPQPSHVVLAMGHDEQAARGALRLSFGHSSTDADVDAFLAALPDAVERAQRAHRAGATEPLAASATGEVTR